MSEKFRAERGVIIMRGATRDPMTGNLLLSGNREERLTIAEADELNRTLVRESGVTDNLQAVIRRARLQRLVRWPRK